MSDTIHKPAAAGKKAARKHDAASRRHALRSLQGDAIPDEIRARGGVFKIVGPDGRSRKCYIIGREPFAASSAVEGIVASPQSRERAAAFERAGLSPEQRRQAIIAAYRQGGG